MTTPRLLLIIPPGWNYVWQPHLSLPSLSAFLRKHGCTVYQQDLNLAFFESLGDEFAVAPLHQRIVAAFQSLDQATVLNPVQQERYANLAWAAGQSVETLARNLRKARQALRDPATYYHLTTCARQSALLNQVWEMVWATFEDQPERRVESLLPLLANEMQNPFLSFLRERLSALLALAPDLVVLSVYYPRQLVAALTLAHLLRKANGRLRIVLEGRHATALAQVWPHHAELFDYVDSIVVGQSERPLLTLARAITEGESLERVPSLIYRHAETVRVNPQTEPESVEALPVPDFEGLPLERYFLPHLILPLQAARGCYWGRCLFCTYNRERGYSTFQPRTAQWLVGAMEELANRYKTPYFTFADEAVSPDLLEQVAGEISRRGLRVYWQAQTRPEASLTPERCRLLAQSGCVSLQFCFETASNSLSKRMGMGLTRDERKMALTHCAEAGILTHIFVVLGLPGERAEEAHETAALVLENEAVIHGVSVEPYNLGKCAPLAEQVARDPRAADDLSLHCSYEEIAGSMCRDEVEAHCLELRQAIRSRFPSYGGSYFPALLYATHYQSRNVADLVRCSQARRPGSPQGNEQRPELRSNVIIGSFRFDLSALNHRTSDHGAGLHPLEHPASYLLDGPSGPVARVSPLAAQVLELTDSRRDEESIAQAVALRFGLDEAEARAKSQALHRLYGTFLEPRAEKSEGR